MDYGRVFSIERLVAGVDEAGRGPLAGPVVAAAVILHPRHKIQGIADSKVLKAPERERLAKEIRAHALAWAVASADVHEIDALNILQATLLAMRRALCGLATTPAHVQIDGNRAPSLHGLPWITSVETVIKGDASHANIGAASILAKTARDAMMAALDLDYPGYGFAKHMGYPTLDHYAALARLGPTVIHRRSFTLVKSDLSG
jgi:ribonuclease HII